MEKSKIERITELVFLSSLLKNERPLSLILIAPPEQSKSYNLLKFSSKYAHISTDLSYSGLIKLLILQKKVKQIVIPDFLKVTEKGKNTKKSIITAISNFTEEGIFSVNLGNKEIIDLKGRSGGIITATTTYSFFQNRKNWAGLGFSSRFLCVRYEQTEKTILNILEKIANKDKKETATAIKGKIKEIKDNKKLNKKLISYSRKSSRFLKNLIVLLKTISLSNNHDIPTEKDFSELLDLIPYINTDEVVKV